MASGNGKGKQLCVDGDAALLVRSANDQFQGGIPMKKMSMPALWSLWVLFLVLFFAMRVQAGPSYVGMWQRAAKYVDGILQNNIPATLVLSETSYSSIIPAPPDEACAFTGSMTVHKGRMRVVVKVSACPETIPVGMLHEYYFAVTERGRTLTTTRTIGGKRVKQVYHRQRAQKSDAGTIQRCSHPLCGTWNRTATSVNGKMMNTTPAYTVITEKTYYSIAPACSNTLTIDSFHGNSFTMTMVSHNCPTGGPVMGPGTVVEQIFTLTNEGNTLTIINTEYGGEVKTVFQRLK